jgi:hypothetical protein
MKTKNENVTLKSYKNVKEITSKKFPKSLGYYEIRRYGQQAPAAGDGVVVELIIYLPSRQEEPSWNNPEYLDKRLEFNERYKFAGECMYDKWGRYNKEKKLRYINKFFTADKWCKAFMQAAEYAEREFYMFEKFLEKRERALINAEKCEE